MIDLNKPRLEPKHRSMCDICRNQALDDWQFKTDAASQCKLEYPGITASACYDGEHDIIEGCQDFDEYFKLDVIYDAIESGELVPSDVAKEKYIEGVKYAIYEIMKEADIPGSNEIRNSGDTDDGMCARVAEAIRLDFEEKIKDGELAEVVHGHWRYVGGETFECSQCGARFCTDEGDIEDAKYCFWCGAKMDLEEEK